MRELFKRVFKKEEGFSLIELIIVIAILAIIAAIAVPNLLANIRRANEGADISNAKLIADSISTTIAQNPEYEGVVIGGLEFVTSGGATDAEEVVDLAVDSFTGTIPTVKASTNGTVGANFEVTTTAAGDVTVASDTTVLYPE
ncbi:MAG: peptidase [Firmicutes bacterium HGW-Firmicutes-5]|nr:MAG: peptidase [Firmicutes bacterium HGW-Firmicutes-5]